ncbi:MAG: fatty acid desaturase [Lentisphaeria bacterium]|nr:fatty acid desaturase [Lentisphaeria bacterium]
MKIFKYKADRVPVILFVALFALDLLVFYFANQPWMVIAWLFIGIFPKTCVCAFGHHHQHLNTFHQPIVNRLYEIIIAFETGITSQAWFLHHVVGHHKNYLDQTKDESRWMREDGTTMGEVEYSVSVAVTGYPRAAGVGFRFPKHMRIFLSMILVQIVLLTGLFYYNWFNALFVFLLPMVISLYITAWHTYYHHAGIHSDDDFSASYNCMHRWYNILTGNLGYHTDHHIMGGMHWSELPKYHEEIKDKIPEELFRKPWFPYRWIPESW